MSQILFDTDGVLTTGVTDDHASPEWKPRPGIADVISVLAALGFELHAWSANGADHARAAAALSGTTHRFSGFWPKPTARPIQRADAESILGFTPVLTIDDKNEFIPGVPLLLWALP